MIFRTATNHDIPKILDLVEQSLEEFGFQISLETLKHPKMIYQTLKKCTTIMAERLKF